jgi:polysaccharide deacetylase family sporulation protein PdaB
MFLVIRKRSLVAGIVLALMIAVFIGATAAGDAQAVFFGESKRKIPVYGVQTEEKVIALTFDAAWGADKTRQIIALLKEYGANATFFLVGFWIDEYPEETKYISECGLEIGNHSNNHLKMSTLSATQIEKEITTVNERLLTLTGKKPTFFRPPFGDYNNTLMTGIEKLEMVAIQWSIDSLDWKGLSGAEIAERVLSRAHDGAIVLFHNNSEHILDALPLVLLGLKNKGYTFVGMSELVHTENFYVDNNGIQHKNAN